METTIKQQKAKLTGSFFNWLMGNNQSVPEVGKGATVLHYSDRSCYEVIEVSADGKTVKLERLDAKWDKTKQGGEGHQNWILEPTGYLSIIVWRNNAWKFKGKEFKFTKEMEAKLESSGKMMYRDILTAEEKAAVYINDSAFPSAEVSGITIAKDTYNKVNILFGTKEYYYDWSF